MSGKQTEFEDDVVVDEHVRTRKPKPHHVILHNDDYTTMDFVVTVLETIFNHPSPSAVALMQLVHEKGRAVAGTYSLEIAETKASETMSMARKNGYPLKCSVEPA
jgi:ATP-dependent Clp protease adaptor protein ClpS